jgi:hypothetical protein
MTFHFQYPAASGVSLDLLQVNTAVDFDDQARNGAVKVYDESANRVLAAEFEAKQPAVAQALPQNLFCRGHGLAQLFGALLDRGGGADAFGSHWNLGLYGLILHEIGWRGTPFSPIF